MIAQDSGNRTQTSVLATDLARLEAEHGDTVSAFDHLTLAIRNFHNAGDTTTIRTPLASLATVFDWLRRYERRPLSLASPSVPSPRRGSPKSPPRSPTSARSSATRPTNP